MEQTRNKSKRKRVYQRLALIIFIIVLDVVAAKLFIPKNSLYNDFRTEHSYYHHSLLPYQHCITNINVQNEQHVNNILNVPYIESSDYIVNTNSLGFIDKTMRKVEPFSDKERIVFIGGSFVEGYGCTFDSTFAGILLDKYDKNKYDILNAGVVAYSPKLIYLKTKFLLEVQKLHIDRLIVFSNTFEIADEIIYEQFKPKLDKSDLRYNRTLIKLKNFFHRNSFVYYALGEIYRGKNLLQDPSRPKATIPIFEEIWPTKEHFAKERMLWEFNPYFEKWGNKGYTQAEKNITALFDLCKTHNIKITAVSHPILEEIRENHKECLYSKLWEEYCNKYDANFINLYPLFMDNGFSAEENIKKYYIEGDGHWKVSGHKLVADFLFKEMNFN